jgi:hypothetical protein
VPSYWTVDFDGEIPAHPDRHAAGQPQNLKNAHGYDGIDNNHVIPKKRSTRWRELLPRVTTFELLRACSETRNDLRERMVPRDCGLLLQKRLNLIPQIARQ